MFTEDIKNELKDEEAGKNGTSAALPLPRSYSTNVINAENVAKAFGDKLLYDNLNFSLPPAGIVGIIGPNGAGKTTIFKMKCMDDDFGKDDEVGQGTFKLSQICGSKLEGTPSFWVKLQDAQGKLVSEIEIETKFKVNPPVASN